MKTVMKGKRISGILGILPQNEFFFDDEVDNYNFPSKQTMRLKKIMGFNKHRISKEKSTASQFCIQGVQYLLDNNLIRKEEVGAILVVTLSPDYFVPQISNIIQGDCGFDEDVLCIDLAQGCCGFILGLLQSCMLLDIIGKEKKVLLFNTDILSHKVSKKDRNDFPLIGDASAITIVEHGTVDDELSFHIKMDGSQRDALIVPAGGFAMPSTKETGELIDLEDGNQRALDHLTMDGTGIFNFVQTKVPPLIQESLADCGLTKEDIDYYLFHQPNKFMLQKLADKLEIPYEKMFMNIVENYGNPSGVSIPINIVHNLKDELIEQQFKCCLSSFGSGLAWGSVVMNLGKLNFCEMTEVDL